MYLPLIPTSRRACGVVPLRATGILRSLCAQLLAVLEISQNRCWLKASIGRVGLVGHLASMEASNVQHCLKTGDSDVAQLRRYVQRSIPDYYYYDTYARSVPSHQV